MEIKQIKNERDYEKALRRVEELWESQEGSQEYKELDLLATLIEEYEDKEAATCPHACPKKRP